MNLNANYSITFNTDHFVLIEDEGPWDVFPTITNSVERVLKGLIGSGKLDNHQRLFFIDSDREFAEIEFNDEGEFTGFVIGDLDPMAETCFEAWKVVEKHVR